MAQEENRTASPARKRAAITLLLLTNIALLAGLLSFNNATPSALAQPGVRGGEYVCVTAKPSGQAYDVLFVLDPASHKMYGFYPAPPPAKKMLQSEPRDVRKDFGN
jgi:hypothetical protein